MIYTAYGLTFSSSIALPELPTLAGGRPTLRIRHSRRAPGERGWKWLQARPRRRRGTWVAVAARDGEYRLVFDGGAEFLVAPSDATIVARRRLGLSITVLRHRLIDQVIPMAMSHLGRIVLHASAVSTAIGAAAFAGPAGAGKSTLASSFALAGTPVLSDDALFLGRSGGEWLAVPAYPGVRLSTAGGPKERLTSADGVRFEPRRRRLRRLYVIERSAGGDKSVRIERVTPRDAIMALIEYAFVLDTDDRDRMAAHFARVSAAAGALEVRRLVYPGTLAALPRVRDAVLADIET